PAAWSGTASTGGRCSAAWTARQVGPTAWTCSSNTWRPDPGAMTRLRVTARGRVSHQRPRRRVALARAHQLHVRGLPVSYANGYLRHPFHRIWLFTGVGDVRLVA